MHVPPSNFICRYRTNYLHCEWLPYTWAYIPVRLPGSGSGASSPTQTTPPYLTSKNLPKKPIRPLIETILPLHTVGPLPQTAGHQRNQSVHNVLETTCPRASLLRDTPYNTISGPAHQETPQLLRKGCQVMIIPKCAWPISLGVVVVVVPTRHTLSGFLLTGISLGNKVTSYPLDV